jgi:hypothetical protein
MGAEEFNKRRDQVKQLIANNQDIPKTKDMFWMMVFNGSEKHGLRESGYEYLHTR